MFDNDTAKEAVELCNKLMSTCEELQKDNANLRELTNKYLQLSKSLLQQLEEVTNELNALKVTLKVSNKL